MIDLVVSAVLAAMGLFMLPPSLVALPLKLILFVLADGWMLVASMLLQELRRRLSRSKRHAIRRERADGDDACDRLVARGAADGPAAGRAAAGGGPGWSACWSGSSQTLTQMHEPVVGLVPRLVAVLLVVLALLPWLLGRWVVFATHLIESIPERL